MLSFRNIFIIAVTLIILLFIFTFLKKTKMGQSMQAIAQNKELAYMSGINIRNTITFTFILGGVLLSIGSLLLALIMGIAL